MARRNDWRRPTHSGGIDPFAAERDLRDEPRTVGTSGGERA